MDEAGELSDGIFIVFEGIDGSGTTTQCERFAQRMRAARQLVHVTREPSHGPVGTMIRLVLTQRMVLPQTHQAEAMALLFAADRLDHVASEIDPLLRDGYVVVSDRYDLSSLAYQSTTSAASESAVAWIRELNRHARRPDLTLVLDVSPEVAAARRRARGGAVELFDDADLQARLAAAYRKAEDFVPGDRVIHIDGDQDAAAVEAAIARALDPMISSRRPAVR
ncbi:MAG: dTMP kinase [Byssovorax sp.]